MNFLIKEYAQLERTSFKTFLAFSFLVLIVLIPSFSVFSSYWRVETIQVEGSSYINQYQFLDIYNRSIWIIEDASFEYMYELDATIKNITHVKKYPNELSIKVTHFPQIAEITDLRKSVPTKVVLYKNLFIQESSLINDVVTVTITNGPVDDGFNGEIVSLVMTLLNFDIKISDLSIVHNGRSLKGVYRGINIDFLEPIDLSVKGSAVGELLEKSSCISEVTFISSNSFVTDCEI